jgi:hypothetical protein
MNATMSPSWHQGIHDCLCCLLIPPVAALSLDHRVMVVLSPAQRGCDTAKITRLHVRPSDMYAVVSVYTIARRAHRAWVRACRRIATAPRSAAGTTVKSSGPPRGHQRGSASTGSVRRCPPSAVRNVAMSTTGSRARALLVLASA